MSLTLILYCMIWGPSKRNMFSLLSEKLYVGFGLLKPPFGAIFSVFKNLRICGDCHNAFKFMSKVVERERLL